MSVVSSLVVCLLKLHYCINTSVTLHVLIAVFLRKQKPCINQGRARC